MTVAQTLRVLCFILAVLIGMAWLTVSLVALLGLRHYGLFAIWPLHLATGILVPGLWWLSTRKDVAAQ